MGKWYIVVTAFRHAGRDWAPGEYFYSDDTELISQLLAQWLIAPGGEEDRDAQH